MYLEYYGLKEAPFNLTPDPKFLFFTHNHREAFDHLIYGIDNRKGFVELTGEVGSGKTTICRAVLTGLTRSVKTSLVFNPCLTESQLLRSILNDFGLKIRGRDRLGYIETLNAFLLDNLHAGNNVALIIDEAQDLSPAVLEQVRLLSNLETDQSKLLQIVLCGQPELRQRLASPEFRQLRQRISVRYHLLPLNESETGQYIEHRLRMAGWEDGRLFAEEAVRQIHYYARGIPRLINAVCDLSLLAGYVASAAEIGAPCVNKAVQQLEGQP